MNKYTKMNENFSDKVHRVHSEGLNSIKRQSMTGNRVMQIEIVKRPRSIINLTPNITPTRVRWTQNQQSIETPLLQESLKIDSSHHFQDFILKTPESPGNSPKKINVHFLEFYRKRKTNIRDSVLQYKSNKNNQSLSPKGIVTQKLENFPKIIQNKIKITAENKLKVSKIKEITSTYKSYSTISKRLKKFDL